MAEIIHQCVLANGLVVLAAEMPWLTSAGFTLLVPAGTAYEPEKQNGLAALVCEMTLRGAGDLDSRAFINALESLGVEWSESVNAAHISYGGATIGKQLPEALSIFADVVQRPRFDRAQLEPARQVVLQEIQAIEDDPPRKVAIELRRRHFPYPWGRPVHGCREHIESMSITDVQEYFARHFRPNGSILAVAGQLDWNELLKLVEELFGKWPSKAEPHIVEQPPQYKCWHIAAEVAQTQIGIAFPGVPYRDSRYFQACAAVSALGGGPSSRLFTEVREKRGLCYSVSASYSSLKNYGAGVCYAATSNERAQETLDVMVDQLRQLFNGVRDDELQRVKARMKSSLVFQQESSVARSATLAHDWYHLESYRTVDELGQIVDELTTESVNRYLAEYPLQNLTVVTLGPRSLETRIDPS